MTPSNKSPGANRRWRLPFRYRGSRRESAVAQLFSLGIITHMITNFLSCFAATLIGMSFVAVLRWRMKPEWRHLRAMILEVVGFSLGMAVPELLFSYYPTLRDGWSRFATRLIVLWAFYMPAFYLSQSMRKRDRDA